MKKIILLALSILYFCSPFVVQAQNSDNLARPEDITLKGSVRSEVLNSPIGTVNLRWPRSLEAQFGRTPSRAMVDAANTVSKALKSSAFPKQLQLINQKWEVIFIGGELRAGEIPMQLISNCHPGWMTPPANIYIVGDRIAGGCGGAKKSAQVADADLTEVLVHELGHAVEFILLGNAFGGDRMRAEGFATWFETYAAGFSSYLNPRELKKRNAMAAEYSFKKQPTVFTFSGSGEDYSRASLYFSAIEEKYGLGGVMRLYSRIPKTGGLLVPAISEEMRWSEKDLNNEVLKLISKYK